jgi:hypothetical protein
VDWLDRDERAFLLFAGCAPPPCSGPPQEKEREEEEEEEERRGEGGRYDDGTSGDAVKHGGDGVRTLKTWSRGRCAESSISCFCC